ncbi:MAG: DUF3795 domain-containing protein [Bacteriovoracaceae bacterium]|nr:DUF3795 domain-containing protein [Bacteroidota bacterium]
MHPVKREHLFQQKMIASCGMNCGVCIAHLRTKNQCPGCRTAGDDAHHYCLVCTIRNCRVMSASGDRYCHTCDIFPCQRLRKLDKRYRTSYSISLIGNLLEIERNGIRAFLSKETERWRCPQCGNTLSVHRPNCPVCGAHKQQKLTTGF